MKVITRDVEVAREWTLKIYLFQFLKVAVHTQTFEVVGITFESGFNQCNKKIITDNNRVFSQPVLLVMGIASIILWCEFCYELRVIQ